ncbi:MAG: 2-isopropylmalate synthase [Planctomycetota bacterium]|jgi:isopropylmalate/homocitrate/citramalate synthase|nr:2-isopropylmalate synthase [Planctomycetota bacterium]MDP7255089.1 2-isopropylmalate synthase [Planctomycetota bacterium]
MELKDLTEVEEPNLLEDLFPHVEVPRITFDGKIYEEINGEVVEFDPQEALKRNWYITDTTFRDGQQARPPYTVDQIVDLYNLLAKLSGPKGIIRQSEFFLYTEKDRQAVDRCREQGNEFPEITGWIRAHEGDFRLVKEMKLAETGMLTSSSDYHIFYKLKMDRKKAMDFYVHMASQAIENEIRPRLHLEDLTRADIPGFVVPYVQRLMELGEQAPDHLKPKIRLCDTMGFGISYPGAALPRSIPKLVHTLSKECGCPSDRLEWHGHNDFHKVHINGSSCWLYGCDFVNCTLLGYGERTGNPPLEGAVIEYAALRGTADGMDLRVISEIANYMRNEIGSDIPINYPFVGRDFNVTRAGIHADGLNKDERIYNIFDTDKVLGRPHSVAITDKSGVDGVVHWVNNYLGLEGKDRLGKLKLVKIARWVMDEYETGRNTAISEDEMEALVKEHLPQFCNGK